MSPDFSIENKVHPKIRLNAICPYFTMFPLTFPFKVLSKALPGDWVYDPFCGRGTTNFAARLLGLSSYGVDSNPIAHAVAQAKLVNVKPEEVTSRCKFILSNSISEDIPEGEFWQLAYHPDTLTDICKLRSYFMSKDRPGRVDIALRAVVLGILHGPKMKTKASYLSNQMPRTFSTKPDYSVEYWKKNNLFPDRINILELVKRKSEYIFNEFIPEKVTGKIILGDSREIDEVFLKKVDWIVTSPPYFGMSTYEQDQWLRNWFLGGSSKVDYSNKGQLKHWSEKVFVNDLAKVWANAAKKSNPSAKLIIRFGALPSKSAKTPADLIRDSLNLSNCGWVLDEIQTAGEPVDSKRQANQFKGGAGKYVEEIDVFATLKP